MAPITTPLARVVIGAAIDVHRTIGPGLLETIYDSCFAQELRLRHVAFETQVPLTVIYKGTPLGTGYRADFIIERTLMVELKSVEVLQPVHHAQVPTYLRVSGLPQALLINFNATVLRDGLKSFLNSPDRVR